MNLLGDRLREALEEDRFFEKYIGRQLGILVAQRRIEMVKVDGETKFRIPSANSPSVSS